MSERDETVYLADMLEAVDAALRYMDGRTRAELAADQMLFDAVVRQLEVLGEAATHVSESTRSRAPAVPWRGLVGMRNVLIHAYHRVDLDVVWKSVTTELPVLRQTLASIATAAKPTPTD